MKKILAVLISATVALSIAGLFFPPLQAFLALSIAGLQKHSYWQFFSYVLIEPGPLSLSYLLALGFNMYLLWTFGTSLLERSRPSLFLLLYFGSALLAGLPLFAFPHAILAGATPAIYALLTSWMMLNQGAELLLFFAIPLKAHWLIMTLIGFTLFFAFTQSSYFFAFSLLIALLYGYLFALIVWRVQGPFAILHPLERKILRLLEKKKETYRQAKIYDIKSGHPILSDEEFMDAMLDRISRHGPDSLTRAEKKRMQEISAKKR